MTSQTEQYTHHGKLVSVISTVKGQHSKHCLCLQNCRKFKPNSVENCVIAQSNFELCVRYNTVQPVYECPNYELSKRKEK